MLTGIYLLLCWKFESFWNEPVAAFLGLVLFVLGESYAMTKIFGGG